MSRQEQLESVAKDWSLVIRASQVLPVYPLSEDLQPGDIFFVQMPVARQHEAYTQKGFLPFENHVARLNPAGYKDFYANSFATGDSTHPLPKSWLDEKPAGWAAAPQAGFPTYSFSVKRGSGFSAALPVQGVPIGLSLLGTDSADGSIIIDKARTYGVDELSLYDQVSTWSKDERNRLFLAHLASGSKEPSYLRVITRVYVVGRLIVSLNSASSAGGDLSAGATKPLELVTSAKATDDKNHAVAQYEDGLERLSRTASSALEEVDVAGVKKFLPGASFKIVAASASSITTSETFIDRPLVIGYLGFDCLLGRDGDLGPPLPSWNVINNAEFPKSPFSSTEEEILRLRQAARKSSEGEPAILERAATIVGGSFKLTYDAEIQRGSQAAAAFGNAMLDFLKSEADLNGPKREALARALSDALHQP